MRVCSGAGCLRVVDDRVRYCDECKPPDDPPADDGIRVHTLTDRERYAHLYSSARWQRLRLRALRRQPVCARCDLRISEIVDHTVPAGVALAQVRQAGRYGDPNAGFFLLSNLQGLCRSCHWLKTNEDKAHTGPWPDVLATGRRTYGF